LLVDLRRSFGKQAENVDLQVEILPDCFLNMDMAVPFGLIVNELISNAFKYAFKPREGGTIWIQAGLEENRKLFLNVRDNGIGLPLEFDLGKIKTLGLVLVQDLIEQLDGTLQLVNSNGVSFLITLRSE
jgi:two-component sensor histidine kinase